MSDHASTLSAPPTPSLTPEEQRTLLDTAEEAIRARLERRDPDFAALGSLPARLAERLASFVTLREGPQLLGCIGTIEPYRPLITDVAENAQAAAFHDPRLPALRPDQFEWMTLKVSVLSQLVPMPVHDHAELAAAIEPGVDGLYITAGRYRGTFLPSVWEQMRSTREFVGMLWQKAGLPVGVWPAGLRIYRYRTLEFGSDGPRPSIKPPA
ncbi:MAG: AmmeMemoRadiSam system protein A [Acidimicrobiales bacterium]|nr:AmmeMemoRadiSam system protein A [Acidimicrobiales bacterium]